MANFRKINELTVINDESNITGTENILVEKDGAAALVPMNMIKASSNGVSGGYVIDMTADDYDPIDTEFGAAVLELIRNGTPIYIYRYLTGTTADPTYSPVVFAEVTLHYTNNEGRLHLMYFISYGTNIGYEHMYLAIPKQ